MVSGTLAGSRYCPKLTTRNPGFRGNCGAAVRRVAGDIFVRLDFGIAYPNSGVSPREWFSIVAITLKSPPRFRRCQSLCEIAVRGECRNRYSIQTIVYRGRKTVWTKWAILRNGQ